MRLDAAFDLFQEAAMNHAEYLGVGKAAMLEKGEVWILSRMSLVFEKRPTFLQNVTVRSWPRGSNHLFAVRDYDIRDEADTVLARARSGWLILDAEHHRPMRPEAVMSQFPKNEGLDALLDGAGGLKAHPNLAKAGTHTACYTDIDGNGHVNNARYIEWIQNALDAALLTKANELRIDVNYLNETKLGETIMLSTGMLSTEEADTTLIAVEGVRAEPDAKSTPVIRTELRIK
jgi:acyl-ACP thioesterase